MAVLSVAAAALDTAPDDDLDEEAARDRDGPEEDDDGAAEDDDGSVSAIFWRVDQCCRSPSWLGCAVGGGRGCAAPLRRSPLLHSDAALAQPIAATAEWESITQAGCEEEEQIEVAQQIAPTRSRPRP
jgi:hypothetical protein